MRKTKLLRILTLICAIAMLSALFVSCGDDDDDNPEGTVSTIDADISGMSEEAKKYLPEQQNLGGYEYRMMVQYSNEDHLQYYLSKEGLTGDAISIALFERETFLKDYFNIKITVTSEGESTPTPQLINTAMLADDDLWDVCFQVAGDTMGKNVVNGDFIDLFQTEGLNLAASYWDQRIQEQYCIDGMLFCLEGDFTVLDELRTHGVVYNADIYESLRYDDEYGSPYEMVSEGKWTYDTMLKMFKGTSVSDGVGELGKDDRWGMLSESMAPHVFLLGSGNSASRTVNGSIQLMFDDNAHYQTVYEILDHILNTLYVNNTEVLFADASNGVLSTSATQYFKEISDMFENDQALFRSSTLIDATWLTNMQSRFGILPVPKYTEEQEEYYCWTASAAHAPLAIPRTVVSNGHLDKTIAITEAMCYFSRYMPSDAGTLYDAFYERMTVAKLCRTPEDYQMLELIYKSKTFDIDSALNFSHLINVGISVVRGGASSGGIQATYDTLSSTMASLRDSASLNLRNTLNSILENTIKIEE
ncbi:MAG: hypothetical protein IJY08_02620 [Clostridia bacterium]|nr:hypothetical protein [Clostridia bacterium]